MQLKIDPEFHKLHRPLDKHELETLEDNILEAKKVIDPIVVWKENGIILDGEHRWKFATKHGIPYKVEEVDLDSRDDAKAFILSYQLGRRNLDALGMAHLRAEVSKAYGTKEAAEICGTSQRTQQRAVRAKQAIDLLPEDIAEKINNKQIISTQKDLARLADLDTDSRNAVIEEVRKDPAKPLADHIPKRPRQLSPEDFQELSSLNISGEVRQAIALGDVKITKADVETLRKLHPKQQITVSLVLEDDEVKSCKEAIGIVCRGAPKKTKVPADVGKLAEQGNSYVTKLVHIMDEIGDTLGDRSRTDREDCIAALKHFHSLFNKWTGRYSV